MKVFAILAATAFAVASAQAPDCDLDKLRAIIGGTNGKGCQADAGFNALGALTGGFPTGDALKKACTAPSCKAFLAEMVVAVPTECNAVGIPVKATLIDKFPPACAQFEGPATTPAPGPTTAGPTPGASQGAGQTSPTPAPTKDDSC